MEEWRAGLWRQAVERQGLQCSSEVAAQLQACFSSTRLELFQFLPGVHVRWPLVRFSLETLESVLLDRACISRARLHLCSPGLVALSEPPASLVHRHAFLSHVLIGGPHAP